MSDKAPTRWSILLRLALKLRLMRLRLRILQIDIAILRKKIELVQVMVASGSRPDVKPESLARLAASAEAISAHTIPAMEQRYRKAVIEAVVRVAPRIILLGSLTSSVPPAAAYFLLDRLLIKADRDAILGDMEEEFKARLAEDGPTRARRWFWRETVWMIVQHNPIVRSVLSNGLMRLGEWIFRQIGS